MMLLESVWDALDPFPHVRQLLNGVGFVVKLAADSLELLTSLVKKVYKTKTSVPSHVLCV